MNSQRLILIVLTYIFLVGGAEAQNKTPTNTPSVISANKSLFFHVGKRLQDTTFKTQTNTDWKLTNQLARKITALVFINKATIQNDSFALSSVMAALASPAVASKTEGLDVVLVLPKGVAFPAPTTDKPGKVDPFTTVSDTSDVRQQLLGDSPAPYAVALVDQAGFLRRLEAIPTSPVALEMLSGAMKRLRNPAPALTVGEPAPDFSLEAVSLAQPKGFPLRLSDYRGQKSVLVTFFPRCFTGQCTFQLSSLRDQRAAFEERDVQVIAVSVDPAEGEKGQLAFAQTHQFLFPFIPDTGRNLCILYDSVRSPDQLATRMSVFIDKAGIVRWIDKQISPSTHGADVIARIDAENAVTASK